MPPEAARRAATDAVANADLLPDTTKWDDLPAYAELLTARHEAHAATFERMIADLPAASRVVDIAIGDGFYTGLLAGRYDSVVGVDVDEDFLDLADEAYVDRATLLQGDATALPFEDDAVDLVWCAHSLRSLPDGEAAVREWARITRPGGHVAILENDRLHAVLLPWPPEVELTLYHAECRASDHENDRPLGGLHAGRRLHRLAETCGLSLARKTSYTTDATPAGDADRAFLKLHLAELVSRTRPELTDDQWDTVAPWVDPDGAQYLPASSVLEMTFLDVVAVMQKPE